MSDLLGSWSLERPPARVRWPWPDLMEHGRIAGRQGQAAGYGLAKFSDRITVASAPGLQVLVAGQLFDLPPAESAAQHIARLYDANRLGYAASLSGEFVAAVFDEGNARLVLLRDKVGVRPLYFTHVDGRVIFATLIKTLLTHPAVGRRPNLRAIGEFYLGARWLHPDETFFQGVRRLPAAHALVADRSGVHVREYWRPHWQGYLPAKADLAGEFGERFTEAVRRRLRGNCAVFVSGGLDSSSIYCVAHELTPTYASAVYGLTFSPSDGSVADEQVFLRSLETFTGHQIERMPVEDSWLQGGTAGDVWDVEIPAANLPFAPDRLAREKARAWNSDVILDGGWGDNVLAPWPPVYLWELLRSFRLRSAIQHWQAHSATHSPEPRAYIRGALLRMLAREAAPGWLLHWRRPRLNRLRERGPFTRAVHAGLSERELLDEWLPSDLPPHPKSLFGVTRAPYFAARIESSSKFTSYYGAEARQPFLDLDLIEFLMRVPPTTLYRDGVYKAILRAGLRRRVPDLILNRRDKGIYSAPMIQTVRAGWKEMTGAIRDCSIGIELGVFDAAGLTATLQRIEQQDTIDGRLVYWYLFDLYTLAVWLREFFGSTRFQGVANAYA